MTRRDRRAVKWGRSPLLGEGPPPLRARVKWYLRKWLGRG